MDPCGSTQLPHGPPYEYLVTNFQILLNMYVRLGVMVYHEIISFSTMIKALQISSPPPVFKECDYLFMLGLNLIHNKKSNTTTTTIDAQSQATGAMLIFSKVVRSGSVVRDVLVRNKHQNTSDRRAHCIVS